MNEEKDLPLLWKIEHQALAEGREWIRNRIKELIEEEEEKQRLESKKKIAVKRRITIKLNTVSGLIEIQADYGRDRETKQWRCPIKEMLGLKESKAMSPLLRERLSYTATRCLSYEAASDVADKWGCPVSSSTIHRHVEQVGEQIIARREEEIERALNPSTRGQVVAEARKENGGREFSLIIMLDGWMVRERDEQWALKPAEAPANRVAWREMKTGIVFRAEDRAETQSGRRVLIEKKYEAIRGGPDDFGRRLFALALNQGLYQARNVFVIADGAIWIWNLSDERFKGGKQLVDFYHASEHLWEVAHALHPDDKPGARAWVEPLLHQLRHGGEHGVVETLEDLLEINQELSAESQETIRENVGYFQRNRKRLAYQKMEKQRAPVGSGAIESTCSQLQNRFKRTGQFWTEEGLSHLMTLELIRRNGWWDEYWRNVE